jgi:hypothetical protein
MRYAVGRMEWTETWYVTRSDRKVSESWSQEDSSWPERNTSGRNRVCLGTAAERPPRLTMDLESFEMVSETTLSGKCNGEVGSHDSKAFLERNYYGRDVQKFQI